MTQKSEAGDASRLTDEEIEGCRDAGNRAYMRHRWSTRGQQITPRDSPDWHFARAVEAAVLARAAVPAGPDRPIAVQHMELPAIVVCKLCKPATSGVTPAPAPAHQPYAIDGLVAAVAVGNNPEVAVMFDKPEQAHGFVNYLKRFIEPKRTGGVLASPNDQPEQPR